MENVESIVHLSPLSRRLRRFGAIAILSASMLCVSGASGASRATHVITAHSTGTVDVLFAGSLLSVMQNSIEPAFHTATGYSVSGISGGSTGLANQIKGRTVVGDVFVSASPSADASLMSSSNGSWVSSYEEFGTSALVLGYNPASTFAAALKTKPWFTVVDLPHFLLGRTDPATDPKGKLSVNALNGIALSYGLPALTALDATNLNVFPETSLVGRLQAGQLDAGFFYKVESIAAKIKTVPLTSTGLGALYTVAVLNHAPHSAAAKAFVKFLLSSTGRSILLKNGVTAIRPPTIVKAS